MGLLDFLLFGAFLNSLRNNNKSNSNTTDYSNRSYDQAYNDAYDDGYMDHDDYDCSDSWDSDTGCYDYFDF